MANNSLETVDVTVITVCKNAGEDLIRTCESVLNQSGVSLQFLLQDGVSTDATLSYVSSLQDPRVDLVSEIDSGIYDAMNRAFKRVRGKWCIYLNAGDCFSTSESLSKILVEAETDDNTDVFAFAYYNEFDKTITICPKNISGYFLYRNCICHQTQLWRTEVLCKYMPFDQNYRCVADHDILLRAFNSGIKIKTSSTVAVSYKDMGFSTMLNIQSLKESERLKLLSICFSPFERLLYATFEVILLKPVRLHFNRKFRGGALYRFYKVFANSLNRII